MKRFIVIFILLISFYGNVQVNLVQNPSFEEIDSCLDYNYPITRAFGWDTLRNGGGGTPDLFNECCLYPNICGIPYNWNNKGYQYPKSGAGYANFVAVTNHTSGVESREYIQGKLINKLTQGREYCIYIYISPNILNIHVFLLEFTLTMVQCLHQLRLVWHKPHLKFLIQFNN